MTFVGLPLFLSTPDLTVAFLKDTWTYSVAVVFSCDDGVACQCPIGRHHHSFRGGTSLSYPCSKLPIFFVGYCDSDYGFRPRTCPSQTIPVDLYGTFRRLQSIRRHGAQAQAIGLQPTKRRERLLLK